MLSAMVSQRVRSAALIHLIAICLHTAKAAALSGRSAAFLELKHQLEPQTPTPQYTQPSASIQCYMEFASETATTGASIVYTSRTFGKFVAW
jgi:hypothetical protein